MLQYQYKWYFYVVLVCIIATACQLGGSTQPESGSESPIPPTPSPTTSTPTADDNDEPFTIPSPSPDTAVVHGQIGDVAPQNRMFLSGEIYLAPIVELEGENPLPFIRLEPNKDPKASARSDTQEFVIPNVEPGNYGLVFHTPIDDYILPAEDQSFRIIEVSANETIDLGEIDLK